MKTIVLIGRPNVGKSSLYNYLTKTRDAIVADMPGLTRDRHYGKLSIADHDFILVDTGGFEPDKKTGIQKKMAAQTKLAIDESDIILFIVDARSGLHIVDQHIAQIIRKNDKTKMLLVNKAEGMLTDSALTDFRVVGTMNEGTWISDVMQGYSVDNIAPEIPTGLVATVLDNTIELTWNEPIDADFQYFTIFRNGELLDYAVESTYVDHSYGELEYYMTATDANGNESEQSESIMITIEPLVGDVNNDFTVNIQDIMVMINMILPNDTEPTDFADVNQDGTVNILDILIVINIILHN